MTRRQLEKQAERLGYLTEEVKDIVWHAINYDCTVKQAIADLVDRGTLQGDEQ